MMSRKYAKGLMSEGGEGEDEERPAGKKYRSKREEEVKKGGSG